MRDAMPLVGRCVRRMASRVPRHVGQDDLMSAGLLGLTQAAQSWDPARGVSFEHFGRRRIEGALLDELRSRDWASRSARRGSRRLHLVTDGLTARLGRDPRMAEVAEELGVTVDEVARLREHGRRATVLPLEAVAPGGSDGPADEPSTDPVDELLAREMRRGLRDAVHTLPERLRRVVVEYFFEDRPMKDIAEDLGVTVSRVSQLRSEALKRLRSALADPLTGGDADVALLGHLVPVDRPMENVS